MFKNILDGILTIFVFSLIAGIIIFATAAYGSEAEIVAELVAYSIFDRILDLAKVALDVIDVISLVLLIVAVVATVLARICFKIAEQIKKKRLIKKTGKVIQVVDSVNSVILDLVQFCPTFGRNPKSQLLAQELKKLQEKSHAESSQK